MPVLRDRDLAIKPEIAVKLSTTGLMLPVKSSHSLSAFGCEIDPDRRGCDYCMVQDTCLSQGALQFIDRCLTLPERRGVFDVNATSQTR